MRRLLKFLHTTGAIGMMGALASLLAILGFSPASTTPAVQAALLGALAKIAAWVFMPSLALTLIAGLAAIAVTPGFHDAGWVWAKAVTGVLLFEGGLGYVIGPLKAAAKSSALALSRPGAHLTVAAIPAAERHTLWILLGVSLANVALGVWRPRLSRFPVF